MKARNRIGAAIGVTFSFLFVAASFQNCAKQVDFASLEEVTLNGGGSDLASGNSNSKPQTDIDGAPVDAKQTLESMMSLLGLTRTDINMNTVNAEINYRRNLLVAQNDLALVNSPSIIAVTSLAGVVCQQAVIKEKKAAKKDLFKYLDFAKGPSSYGKLGAINTYVSLVERFWMRSPSKEELTLISQAVDEYFGTLDSAALNKAAESDKLAVFICTGLLAVPDSYLL